ncbi:hypothetical protein [Natronococcus sp. A-GB7]|jgi:hypothetical protein|uniref:hypothetical protein n=1 Tax=Natronococcus sp. A-GB7 TaxID=3037649 RepID=UPI00241C2F16|nr:hypothetical protein [Natronococcus sp. A-GB7]MDG5820210.1 hypothetical protein [Natronococcus sp. A-GB7]
MLSPVDADDADRSDRDEILAILSQNIQFIHGHLEAMDLDSREDQELAIKWMRTLGSLGGQYRLLTKDTDLDEMESDLELLQAAREVQFDE